MKKRKWQYAGVVKAGQPSYAVIVRSNTGRAVCGVELVRHETLDGIGLLLESMTRDHAHKSNTQMTSGR